MPNDTFSSLAEGSCGLTHIDLFSTSVHLPFLECKRSGWLALIVVIVIVVKLGQNYLFTYLGQLQREILQLPQDNRKCCSSKINQLLFYEFLAGLIGIISVLVITGNNAIIWMTIIASNLVGVAISFTTMKPDHHSTALELINMLEKYPTKGKKSNDEESRKAYEAVQKLREILKRSEMDAELEDEDGNVELPLLNL